MPLRQFPVGPVGEDVFPRFVAELLYLGEVFDARALEDPATPVARRALLATFDPRNATMEAEYYRELDPAKWERVKPLLWFWQMFDHSPVGRNVRLGTQMRAMLAARVFKSCGKNVRIFHDVAAVTWLGHLIVINVKALTESE